MIKLLRPLPIDGTLAHAYNYYYCAYGYTAIYRTADSQTIPITFSSVNFVMNFIYTYIFVFIFFRLRIMKNIFTIKK